MPLLSLTVEEAMLIEAVMIGAMEHGIGDTLMDDVEVKTARRILTMLGGS